MGRYTELQDGKMQYNASEAKNFRVKLAKWHNADVELANEILNRNDKIKDWNTEIEQQNKNIDAMNNGTMLGSMLTVEQRKAEITRVEGLIEAEKKRVKELSAAKEVREGEAMKLLSDDLYKAYAEYISDGKREEYADALCEFFETNGLQPRKISIDEYVACVGEKPNSTRNKATTGTHNTKYSPKMWRTTFLGKICDIMGDALPFEKYTYELMENRKKKDEETKSNKKKNNK